MMRAPDRSWLGAMMLLDEPSAMPFDDALVDLRHRQVFDFLPGARKLQPTRFSDQSQEKGRL